MAGVREMILNHCRQLDETCLEKLARHCSREMESMEVYGTALCFFSCIKPTPIHSTLFCVWYRVFIEHALTLTRSHVPPILPGTQAAPCFAKKTDGFGGGAAGKARRQWMGRGKEPQGNGRCRHKTTARIVKLEEKLVAYVQQRKK